MPTHIRLGITRAVLTMVAMGVWMWGIRPHVMPHAPIMVRSASDYITHIHVWRMDLLASCLILACVYAGTWVIRHMATWYYHR